MSKKVESIQLKGNNDKNVPKRSDSYTIKQGDTYQKLAQKYGLSVDEFKKWVDYSGEMKPGKILKFPVDTPEKGKGIYALAKKYGMTMTEFCKINGIPDNQKQNYQSKAGELFYVIPRNKQINKTEQLQNKTKPKTTEANTKPKSDVMPKQQEKPKPAQNQKPLNTAQTESPVTKNQRLYGSSYSPDELAKKIYELSGKYYGAVGKPDFDALINEINPKNASQVIKAYDNMKKGESLINTITSEISSKKDLRKNAVLHVYDALAKQTKTPSENRDAFKHELDDQFDSFGMVSTKNLDKSVTNMLKSYDKALQDAQIAAYNKRKVNINSPYEHTVESLRKSAIESAKKNVKEKFKTFCKSEGITYDENKLDLSTLDKIPKARVNKNGNIVPEISKMLKPTGKSNGKVIILNSGHGGYHRGTGAFDVGSYTFKKTSDGKYKPHLEYEKVKPFVNEAANKLRQQGYAVIVTSGEAGAFAKTDVLNTIITNLTKSTKYGAKYSTKDLAFISFHADSSAKHVDENDSSSVCYNPQFSASESFANIINDNLNTNEDTITSKTSKRIPGKNGVFVLTSTSQHIPAVLLETAHLNGLKGRENIEQPAFIKKFVNGTITGLNEYFASRKDEGSKTNLENIRAKFNNNVQNVKTLSDVAKYTDVSPEFIMRLKRSEDSNDLPDNKFHNTPYIDKAGVKTIGIGHRFRKGDKEKLTDAEVCSLLAKDLLEKENDIVEKLGSRKYYDDLPPALKAALLDMVFNKGAGILDKMTGLVSDIKAANYEAVINKMTFNKSTATGKEMAGLSKRRLFDISLAINMYENGQIPKSNIDIAQQVYNRGVELLRQECKAKNLKFENQIVGYNKDIQGYFGDKIKLKYINV